MEKLSISIVLLLSTFVANATCKCVCMNGTVQAVCTNTLDIQPICSPTICPIVSPSVQPMQTPTVPPIGTTNCSPEQIYNQYTGQYEWKTVCY